MKLQYMFTVAVQVERDGMPVILPHDKVRQLLEAALIEDPALLMDDALAAEFAGMQIAFEVDPNDLGGR